MGSRLEKNSSTVRKRIENHTFGDEQGEEYEESKFGGFSDYMRRKKIKLQNLDAELRAQSNDKPQIFRGIVAHVNGYTQPSLGDLHQLIVSHGGGFLQYLEGKTACTHIIASQLTPKKKAEFAKYRIVRPAWIVDSVDAGRLLPWDAYRLVDEGVTQKILGFDQGQVVSQVNRQRQSYRAQTETSWYTSQFGDIAQRIANETRDGDNEPAASREQAKGEHVLLTSDNSMEETEQGNNSVMEERPDMVDTVQNNQGRDSMTRTLTGPAIHPSTTDQPLKAVNHTESTSIDAPVSEHHVLNDRKLTAEEHNANLLQNPHMAKSSTANPDFLNQYYRESRLHHLSAWKADLKAQLQARAREKSSSQKAQTHKRLGARRYIMHVDFDSFFAAVSLRKHPQLVEQPVVVAHGSGPGSEIASCNYPARTFGVKNGMWMKTALELCPHLKVLPYDYKAYEDASRYFYDAILVIDGVVQSISIDEALIDVSNLCIQAGGSDGKATTEGSVYREQKKANEIAQELRISIKEKTGCDVSVGIGGNILLAKVALRKAKPAGQHQILPDDILDFIGELKVTDLPGVAYSLGNKLEELGVKLVKDIRGLTKERLTVALGPKTGEKLWDYSRGIDKVEVGDQVVRKSVSAEVNWGIRFITQTQAEEFVQSLCDELHKRLLENGVKGKQLTMKIMRKAADAGMDPPKNLGHGKCDTFNKSVVLGLATNEKERLGKEAISILRSYGFSPGELRGLGVQMQKLEAIKPIGSTNTTLSDGSQRRLTFKKPEVITATDASTKSIGGGSVPTHDGITPIGYARQAEVIEDVEPRDSLRQQPTVSGAIRNATTVNEKPLNMLGTQFVLPSQVDPAVLAELPDDIRSKLAPKVPPVMQTRRHAPTSATEVTSRSNSPYLSDTDYGLPRQSQIDPEIFAALPSDVKDELLAHYGTGHHQQPRNQGQSLLPQSPRKINSMTKKVVITPTKKHKISSFLNRGRSKTKGSTLSTLTQSNFVSGLESVQKSGGAVEEVNEEIPQSFLDELPSDIRAEILTEQRKNRMKAKSGLNVATSRRTTKVHTLEDGISRGQQTLRLPTRPDVPTFTSRNLSKLSDLREAMSAWVQEFSEDGEQGPFEEDTIALGSYLHRVVIEEGDMAKAISVVDWLVYLIDDWPFSLEEMRISWQVATNTLQEAVQRAVKERGLPPAVFS